MTTKQMIKLGCMSAMCLFASCDKDDDDNDNMLTETDKTYLTNMTYANIGEVNAGNIAKERANHAAIADYGNMMVMDHNTAQQQLKDIASDKNHTLPTDTDAEHKQKAAMLMNMTGRQFDSTYIYMMIEDHDKATALQQQEIDNGSNTEVVAYATSKLTALHMHHHMADSLAKTLFPR